MRTHILALSLLVACRPDDVKTDDSATDDTATDDTGDTGGGGDASALYHTWLSEGENLAPAFTDESEPAQISRVDATFGSDGTYLVTAKVVGIMQAYDFVGTFTTDMSTDPHGITLSQLTVNGASKEVTSQGIWAVEGTTLTYEAIQIEPDAGCSPPTAAGGFGSTTCETEVEAGYYVQVYVLNE